MGHSLLPPLPLDPLLSSLPHLTPSISPSSFILCTAQWAWNLKPKVLNFTLTALTSCRQFSQPSASLFAEETKGHWLTQIARRLTELRPWVLCGRKNRWASNGHIACIMVRSQKHLKKQQPEEERWMPQSKGFSANEEASSSACHTHSCNQRPPRREHSQGSPGGRMGQKP